MARYYDFIGVDVKSGNVVTPWNDIDHYDGLLQCGKGFKIVFHVKFTK